MTLHTEVPVQFEEIRVGDYITGMSRPGAGPQGFVTRLLESDQSVRVRMDGGRELTMISSMRTFTRRVSAADPTFHLVDPQAIVLGDTVTLVRYNEIEDQGTVARATPCGPDHQDFHLTTGATRCTNVDGRSWFRHAPAGVRWIPVTHHTDLNTGDYVRGTANANHSLGIDAPVAQGIVASVLAEGSGYRIRLEEAPGLAYLFDSRDWAKMAVISTTPPSPQKEEVDSRTLNVGDVIIASPCSIGGTMRARVSYVGEDQFDARTLEVLALSSNGREDDEGSIYFYDHGTVTLVSRANAEDPSPPVVWHPIPFSDLQVNDTAQGVGRTNTIQGVVVGLDGPRVRIRLESGFVVGGTAQRKWSVSNRTPAPQPPATTLYPSIHHLKAKLFDILLANHRTGDWCSDVHEFAQELGIADNLYTDSGLQDQARQVEALLTRLRGESAGGRGVTDQSIDAAFQALGVPRHVDPPTRRFQLEIEVPASLTVDRIREMIAAQDNVTLIRNQEVPR